MLTKKFIGMVATLIADVIGSDAESLVDMQYGSAVQSLGKYRYMAVALGDVMNSSGIAGIAEAMLEAELYGKLYKLIFRFPMNNFLHNHFNNIFTFVLKN